MNMGKLMSFWLWVKAFWIGATNFKAKEDGCMSGFILELRWYLEREYFKKRLANKEWDD